MQSIQKELVTVKADQVGMDGAALAAEWFGRYLNKSRPAAGV